ncbi:MAG: AAA family ATPase [Actinomycetota bacterium]
MDSPRIPTPFDAGFIDLFPPDEVAAEAPGDVAAAEEDQPPAGPDPQNEPAPQAGAPAREDLLEQKPVPEDPVESGLAQAVPSPVPEPEAAPPEPVGPVHAPSFPQGRIIAVVNQKGGVGKTTTTINLGAALALEGARVLLVDFDPQGALSVGLGLNPLALETTVYNLLLDRNSSLPDVLQPSKVEGLDLLPSNIDLSAAEIMLVTEVAREQLLKRALEEARGRYNYILIDCPPSLGLLTVNALTAAHGVIVPLECEYFALRGMALLMDTIKKVQERLNPQLELQGIVATIVDPRTLHGREVMSRVADAFGDSLFKTVIHKTIRFAEAPVVGEPIMTYAPKSNGAQEYRDLAREVIAK